MIQISPLIPKTNKIFPLLLFYLLSINNKHRISNLTKIQIPILIILNQKCHNLILRTPNSILIPLQNQYIIFMYPIHQLPIIYLLFEDQQSFFWLVLEGEFALDEGNGCLGLMEELELGFLVGFCPVDLYGVVWFLAEGVILFVLTVIRSEIMDFSPIIIPRIQPNFLKLLPKLRILRTTKPRKMHISRTLNNRLTLTKQRHMTVMTLKSSKLPSRRHNNQIPTIPNKYSTLAWSYIHKTILTIIDVEIGSNIKNKIMTTFTIINIELLTIQCPNFLNFKLIHLIDKTIIIKIDFLFDFRWQDIILWFLFLGLDSCGYDDWITLLLDFIFLLDVFALVDLTVFIGLLLQFCVGVQLLG